MDDVPPIDLLGVRDSPDCHTCMVVVQVEDQLAVGVESGGGLAGENAGISFVIMHRDRFTDPRVVEVRGVPQPQFAALDLTGENSLPVRTEYHRFDRTLMPIAHPIDLPSCGLPEPSRHIVADGDVVLPWLKTAALTRLSCCIGLPKRSKGSRPKLRTQAIADEYAAAARAKCNARWPFFGQIGSPMGDCRRTFQSSSVKLPKVRPVARACILKVRKDTGHRG